MIVVHSSHFSGTNSITTGVLALIDCFSPAGHELPSSHAFNSAASRAGTPPKPPPGDHPTSRRYCRCHPLPAPGCTPKKPVISTFQVALTATSLSVQRHFDLVSGRLEYGFTVASTFDAHLTVPTNVIGDNVQPVQTWTRLRDMVCRNHKSTTDGTDETDEEGQPRTSPIGVIGVIRGWSPANHVLHPWNSTAETCRGL
jgi:hypothetical protein